MPNRANRCTIARTWRLSSTGRATEVLGQLALLGPATRAGSLRLVLRAEGARVARKSGSHFVLMTACSTERLPVRTIVRRFVRFGKTPSPALCYPEQAAERVATQRLSAHAVIRYDHNPAKLAHAYEMGHEMASIV